MLRYIFIELHHVNPTYYQGCHANVMVTTTISSVIIFFIGTCYRGCLCSSQAKHRTPDKKSCTKRFPIDKDDFWLCSQMCVKSSQCTSAARRKAGAPWSGPASTLGRNRAWAWGFCEEGFDTNQAAELSSRPCCMKTTGPLPTILEKSSLVPIYLRFYCVLKFSAIEILIIANLYKVRM